MDNKKNYVIVKDRFPRISEVLNDCVGGLCVQTFTNEPLSSILKKICSKITTIERSIKIGTITSIAAGGGMDFPTITSSGSVILGTPSDVTLSSTNLVSSATHTHAFVPGGLSSQVILGDGSLGNISTLTSTLASTQIGFGSGSNLLTGSSNFTYNGGSSTITVNDNTLIIHGVGNANGMIGIRINNSNSGVSAGSALALYNDRGGINGEIVIQTTSTGYNAFGVSPDIGLIHTTTANGFQVSNFYATPISFGVGGIGGGNIVGQINGITGNWVLTNGSYTPADNGNKLQVTGNQSISGKLGIVTGSPTAVLDINSDTVRLRISRTVTTSADAGNVGDICWDSSFLYICISSNTWRRIAHNTW